MKFNKTNLYYYKLITCMAILFVYAFFVHDSYQMDFRAFYLASDSLINNFNPYVNLDETHTRFIYPPSSLVFVYFLAFFDYPISKYLFFIINSILLYLMISKLNEKYKINFIYISLTLISWPFIMLFERGQIDIIIIYFTIFSFYNKDNLKGPLFLSIAASIKLLPILLIAFYLINKEFKFVYKTFIFIIIWILISIVLFDISYYYDFYKSLFLSNLSDFKTYEKFGYLFDLRNNNVISPDGVFTYSRDFMHKELNPFAYLGKYLYIFTSIVLIVYLIYTKIRKIDIEIQFFGYIVLMLLANKLLWIMGIIWYVPILFYFLNKYKESYYSFIFFLPLFVPNIIPPVNFVLVLILLFYFFLCTTYKQKS